ncbi:MULTISPECIES: cytochrome C oxidase subunit IV family protein [Gulbenkiania]|uniref:Prokaryotic Cytochrome C oxidase subunit IV n=2 Tax=Gulbenkiania TaxID=397456 RepID=A0A0K6GUT1_9NEIS|nr:MULTISPECIES: hypothetical protein [Gulbenkiania]TCW33979.1 hypothetical protein EV669_101517 [Gulbenkiania mobilis]CUA82348.1 Prokaryotic Cytochrome C oxidase subunit IV [Gulbenkiania indica]
MKTVSVYRGVAAVWLGLAALTLGLAALSGTAVPHRLLAELALAGAWLKGGVIAETFMGLSQAPLWLRLVVQGWLATVCGALIASFS